MQIPTNLQPELLCMAKYADHLLLAQAAGGNASLKDFSQDLLWVKASGVKLAELNMPGGVVALRTSDVRNVVRTRRPERYSRSEWHEYSITSTNAAVVAPSGRRPSLETGFHGILGRVVLHLHPVYLNAFTCMEDGHELLRRAARTLFVWIDYVSPGQELAVKVDQALDEALVRSETLAVVLENHGFIASGNTADQVIQTAEKFVKAGENTFGRLKPGLVQLHTPSDQSQTAAKLLVTTARERWPEASFAARPARYEAFNEFATKPALWDNPGPLVPDDVVFCGAGGIRVTSLSELKDLVFQVGDRAPGKLAVVVEGVGTLLLARNDALITAMEETLLAHVLVRMLVAPRGRVKILPARESEYLEDMESEKYRIMITERGPA